MEKQYICPGEQRPISRAVHLSRLATFYAGCRTCPLRHETGHLSTRKRERLEQTQPRVPRSSLLTEAGVRGLYLNELTRTGAARWGMSLAHSVWQRFTPEPGHELPKVAVGCDERSFAPDLLTGVANGLRQMSCEVIDLGQVLRPEFAFLAQQFETAGGLYVTGAGCPPAGIGLDFFREQAIPISLAPPEPGAITLGELEARLSETLVRPTRSGVPDRNCPRTDAWRKRLRPLLHALRPLRVCIAVTGVAARQFLTELFEPLPCRLWLQSLPVRQRDLNDPQDRDLHALSGLVRAEQGHVGLLLDDDLQSLAVLDEQGRLTDGAAFFALLAAQELREREGGTVLVQADFPDPLRRTLQAAGATLPVVGPTPAEVATRMSREQALCGQGLHGQVWLPQPSGLSCDGFLTLARTLQCLSSTDTPLSDRLRFAV